MWYWIVGILLVVIIGFYFLVCFNFEQVVVRKCRDTKELYDDQLSRGLFRQEFFQKIKKEEVSIKTDEGYTLKGLYVEGDKNQNKTIIIVHGITVSYNCSIKYMEMFYNRGWNILIYDQRRHGVSEGVYSSYGYYEKRDLDKWVNMIRDRNGKDAIIGLHGESMGAATVLQYSKINKYVKFIIADCAYSSMNELLKYHLKHDFHIPSFPLLQLTSLRSIRKAKFKFSDVSPINDIKDNEIPVMFVHGKADDFVPCHMSEDMYNAKKGMKKLLLVEGAGHARSIEVDRENYEKEVMSFVDSVLEK